MPRLPRSAVALLSLLSLSLLSHAYTWPNDQYDTLESLLYEGRRSDASNLASLVHPCRKRAGTMASVPAEWLRFAFHDMATHNVDDGTGGMDGSIVYELNRPENFGLGFNQTLSDFEIYPNQLVSRADVITLGAIFSVATCGGPIIPFRGGRVDTWSGGGLGTPEPQHDLATLTESFRKQGFNTEEMIKMVACGHSFGGVRSDDFPDLVAPDPAILPNPTIVDFDTTPAFDNLVVTEYLGGHTQNRLVVSSNATMNSDLRVFEADGNKTMATLTDPAAYQAQCQDILARMLDVVPNGVQLTDPIALLPVKANTPQLTIEQGKLVFKVSLRVAEKLNTTITASQRKVSLFWCDKYGDGKDCSGRSNTNVAFPVKSIKEDINLSPVTLNMGYYFMTYNFIVPISGSASISKFWFEIDDTASGGQKVQYTNGAFTPSSAPLPSVPSSSPPATLGTFAQNGNGYIYPDDSVFFVPMMSHVDLYADGTYTKTYTNRDGTNYTRMYDLVVAVRSSLSPSKVYFDATDVAVPKFAFPVVQKAVPMNKNTSLPSVDGYEFWTARFESAGVQLTLDVFADVQGGTTKQQKFAQTTLLDNTPYVAPGNSSKVSDRLSGGGGSAMAGSSLVWPLLAVVLGGIVMV